MINWSCLAALCVFVVSLPCPSVNALTQKTCANNTACSEANTECVNKTCACKSAFKVDGSACSPKGLGDSCGDIADCQNVTNTICGSSKTCDCEESFKKTGNTCTKKGLGDTCTEDTECKGVIQAHCNKRNKECSCSDGFKIDNQACVAKVIGSPCTSGNKSSVCSMSTLKTDCISGHCACLNKSYTEENDECKIAAGEICTQASDCSLNAVCNKTCSCSSGYVAENGRCLVPVDKVCAKATECVSNAECAMMKCKCLSGYDALKGLCSKHDSESAANSLNWSFMAMLVWLLKILLWRII